MSEKEKRDLESKRKMGSLSEVLGREKRNRIEVPSSGESNKAVKKRGKSGGMEKLEGEMTKSNNAFTKQGRNEVTEEPKELTLAEIKLEAVRKRMEGKKGGKKEVKIRDESAVAGEKEKRHLMVFNNRAMEVMTVEDSDFYDFDEDRVEKSFKKGQVWAIYDDDDGMPRLYGLIDDVISLNPFEVRMSWLDLQNDGDERLTSWEKMGFHISCGKFEVARNDTTDLLNIFSHVVECERAAKKLYRIYPKKGSIWALYNEKELDIGRDSLSKDKRYYDIVVFLTSYSETYGLSLAYLEKVDGFRAVFKRREVGCHAIRWLDKDDFRLFSHQIPARRLSGEEAPHLSGDCWELDPASLPSDLLTAS